MKANKRTHSKRVKNLVTVCTLCAILLTVSTYAWFIGMKTVNVKPFEIKIATTEGLFLSMDGFKWSYNLDVTDKDHFPAYTGNTNFWAPDGLIPVSTVGDMDSTVSRMKLYEKGSLTTTKGGYRLLTSRVDNYNKVDPDSGTSAIHQGKGYVAFDLFIKNLSGPEYYETNEPLNEEAIYLQTNSKVTVGSLGTSGTGIENSVRVAFAQIGRVKGDTADEAENADDAKIKAITGITCNDTTVDDVKVTGICRQAEIWEPNDTKHVQNAINWYSTSCKQRESGTTEGVAGFDVTKDNSYNTTNCNEVTDGTTYPTYAISKEISISDNVDVYDGDSYNGYAGSTKKYDQYLADRENSKLVEVDYFTDTEKLYTGTKRPQFMSLAPNSITKLRVYVYIEGQDIDNYDFASLGSQISVNFGFTKERYNPEDVDYDNVAPLPVTSSL